MAKAMEYDLGENQHDYDKADRAKAVKYYLEYLEDVNESFQKARIYACLGALYATAVNPKLQEKPDYEKARMYFQKVLDLEPTRIDRTTIRARVMLASLDKFGSDRVRADMEVYEWLRSIDEEKMRKLWLPLTPDDEGPSELIIRSTKNLQESLYNTLESNVIAVIKHLPEAEAQQCLLEIEQRLSGTEMEKLSRKHAAERSISLPEKKKTQEPEEVEKPREEIAPEKLLEEKVHEEAAYPAWIYPALPGIIVIGALSAVLLLLLKKKTASSSK
jgi:tetratricopeptide (TPR) repeat protein